ncbi:hypothetical protein PC119_g8911 [Phytophthora cactorum]|nr:hypothetical protein PC119_g8911 [Phytophthora cactorum]
MVAISTHPVGKGEEARRVKRARRQIDSALRNVPEYFSQRITLSPPYKPALTKRGALQKLCGKKNVVGTSACFINKNWYFCGLALLVTAYNSSHESAKLKALITLRVEQLYHVNIEPMVQFTMSDITPSVRKISNLEDTETVYVFDTDTQTQKNERRVCTVGGPFPKGETLIKKVRSLNNYFNTPQRVERLTKVQRYYGLPE